MKKLVKLQLQQGRLTDENGKEVEASFLGTAVARAKSAEPFFVEDTILAEADAYCQGETIEYNAGLSTVYSQRIAPTVYLKIKEELPSADTGN